MTLNNNTGGAVGDCVTDEFSISAPGSNGTPVICGFNTGQHSKKNISTGFDWFRQRLTVFDFLDKF